MTPDISADLAGSSTDRRASWLAVLTAPWVAIVRPRRAGDVVRRAGLLSVIAGFALVVAVLSAEWVALATWDETCLKNFPVTVQPSAGTQPQNRSPEDALRLRSFAEVWADWDQQWNVSPVIWVPMLVAALAVGCHLYGTICLLPWTYDGRPVREAVKATLRVPWVCLGWVSVATAAVTSAVIVAHDQSDLGWARHWASGGPPGGHDEEWLAYFFASVVALTAVSAWLVVAQAQRIAAGAIPRTPPADPGPRCGGCGYSLEHVPANGRCPECGESADKSLSPKTRRGLDWQVGRFDPIANFVRTAFWILLRPTKAYHAMITRYENGRSWSFERIIFVLLTGASVVAAGVLVVAAERRVDPSGPLDWSLLLVPVVLGLWLGFCAWAVHRGVGGVAVLVAAASGEGIDARALSGVVGYESVFLWLAFAIDVTAAYVLLHPGGYEFVEDMLMAVGASRRSVAGLIGMGLCAVHVLLLVAWFYRYRVVYRAVRWANF